MSTIVIKNKAEIEAYIPAWDELAENCIESNAFYESWIFNLALQVLGDKENLNLVLIFSDEPQHASKLIGFFPFIEVKKFHHLPIKHLALWQYPQCFLSTPLIHKDFVEECYKQLTAWVESLPKNIWMIRLKMVCGDGPFYNSFSSYFLTNQKHFEVTRFDRAILKKVESADKFFKEAISKNMLHELKRKRNGLAKLGELTFENLTPESDIDEWITTLLEIENKGWKGKAGTSIIMLPEVASYYKEALKAAFKRGQLKAHKLNLAGTTIAIFFEFIAANKHDLFGIKTAFLEEYSKQSPGMQLLVEMTKNFLSDPNFRWLDSCAEPNQISFNRLWPERRMMRHINIATNHPLSNMLLRIVNKLHSRQGVIKK